MVTEMDVEIIIKGGQELAAWYPKEYQEFEKTICEFVGKSFPGIGGWMISPQLTDRHQKEEAERARRRDESGMEEIRNIIKTDPEIAQIFTDATSRAEQMPNS